MYETVDVFTDVAFGGNPLAVVFGAEDLSAQEMLNICQEFKYSETTFVLPPADAAHTAQVRIFTPAGEIPFAGHPNVGTATVLAQRGEVFGRRLMGDAMVFEEEAGLVAMRILRDDAGAATGAQLVTPQPYESTGRVAVEEVAAALGIQPGDIETSRHQPLIGTTGLPFVLAELSSRDALTRAVGNMAGFARAGPLFAAVDAVHCYYRCAIDDIVDIRCRMHCGPIMGSFEDPATGTASTSSSSPSHVPGENILIALTNSKEMIVTCLFSGSANCALLGLLAEMEGKNTSEVGTLRLSIAQGVEMGRPSLLVGEADFTPDGAGEIRLGGSCVAMMQGALVLGTTIGGGDGAKL